jgi:hypothetical protein
MVFDDLKEVQAHVLESVTADRFDRLLVKFITECELDVLTDDPAAASVNGVDEFGDAYEKGFAPGVREKMKYKDQKLKESELYHRGSSVVLMQL